MIDAPTTPTPDLGYLYYTKPEQAHAREHAREQAHAPPSQANARTPQKSYKLLHGGSRGKGDAS